MKNIILCADGTGNQGGYTPDSNVFKLYQAIDLHNPNAEQISFYDNGVGTQSNKYIRGLSGALGLGFRVNVCDLYEYLARHYDPIDSIYMFGFSRGAAEIRAVNGFIAACGLIDGRGKGDKQLKAEVKTAMKAYAAKPAKRQALLSNLKLHAPLPTITFIGVWDTVSALGFPERTDIAGLGLRVLNWVFKYIGNFVNWVYPHKFYNYELTVNVAKARQALSIDDERTSFWPILWTERTAKSSDVDVQQVWFAGMHSNVGGGYPRTGLANVAYAWMLQNVSGLAFKSGAVDETLADADVNGRIYDSRHGFGIYYRYHPREISSLCREANTEVKVHESVLRRLKLRTANYAPVLLPEKFSVVDNQGHSNPSPRVHEEHWQLFRNRIEAWIGVRKWLYGILLEMTLTIVGIAIYFWIRTEQVDLATARSNNVADILYYFAPQMFDQLIYLVVVDEPQWLIGALLAFLGFARLRYWMHTQTTRAAERIRRLLILSGKAHPDYAESVAKSSEITTGKSETSATEAEDARTQPTPAEENTL